MRGRFVGLLLGLLLAIPVIDPAAAGQPSAPVSSPEVPPPAGSPPLASASPEAPPPASAPASPEVPPPASAPEPSATAGPIETPAPSVAAHARPDPRGRYIVVLKPGADTAAVVARHHRRHGTTTIQTFDRVFHGFTARLQDGQRRALLADDSVDAVVPDARTELAGEVTPTGVARVYAHPAGTTIPPVDADVAIIDTGVARHPDLNVAGGYSCASTDHTRWGDPNGHGTHVAGIVAARDNDLGVVGVAPGARLWAVRVLDATGEGLLSWWVCGLEWILDQRDPTDASRPLFEAANMSITKWGTDDHACGSINHDVVHAAVCRLVDDGTTVVVAAANDHSYASRRIPASYDEVITVSALADTDGKPGGLGGRRCYDWGTYDRDDTFADFSNYGTDVDLIAPGKCIWSTVPPSGYGYLSGTSMATPTVAGAVARYKATRPLATPAEVKEALQYLGNLGWNVSTDPDTRHEKLLDLRRLGVLGSFRVVAPSGPRVIEAGGSAAVPFSITRTSTFFERVRFAVRDVPAGWTARVSPSSLLGWTANAASLVVSVPKGTPVGAYRLTVTATNQGRARSMTVEVAVTDDIPTARTPYARPAPLSTVGLTSALVPSSVAVRVAWSAASDPSSAITAYEVQRRVDDGAWSTATATAADRRYLDVPGRSLSSTHRFRVRAKDAVGHWSRWVESIDYRFSAVSDRSSSIGYAGAWRRATSTVSTNGVRTTSATAGALARVTVTGIGVAVVMPRSDIRGKVGIYVDDVRVATVDTHSTTAQPRRVVWATVWPARGTHRLTLRVSGTPGRPTVSLDGLIVTR